MATVSVIMSNYNYGQWVGRAIDAVIHQTRRPDQFILMDDGSTDNSVGIIREAIKGYDWIQFEPCTQNQGVLKVFNKLLDLVRTDYVYCASSDDYMSPKALEVLMHLAETHPQAGLVFGNYRVVDVMDNEVFVSKPSHWVDHGFYAPEEYLAGFMMAEHASASLSASTMYKVHAMRENLEWPDELGSWGDTFMIHRIARTFGVCYANEVVASCMLHSNSFSDLSRQNPWKMLKTVEYAYGMMLSPRYQALFPPSFANKWRKEFKEHIASHSDYFSARRESEVLEYYKRVMAHAGFKGRFLYRVASVLYKWTGGLMRWVTRSTLIRFNGLPSFKHQR